MQSSFSRGEMSVVSVCSKIKLFSYGVFNMNEINKAAYGWDKWTFLSLALSVNQTTSIWFYTASWESNDCSSERSVVGARGLKHDWYCSVFVQNWSCLNWFRSSTARWRRKGCIVCSVGKHCQYKYIWNDVRSLKWILTALFFNAGQECLLAMLNSPAYVVFWTPASKLA